MMATTYYDTLQVSQTAHEAVIRASYKALSQRYHPDKHPDNPKDANQNMARLNAAYEVLGDSARRAAYDQHLRELDEIEQQVRGHRAGSAADVSPRDVSPVSAAQAATSPAPETGRAPAAASARRRIAGWLRRIASTLWYWLAAGALALLFFLQYQSDLERAEERAATLAMQRDAEIFFPTTIGKSSPTKPQSVSPAMPASSESTRVAAPTPYPPSHFDEEPRRLYEQVLAAAQVRHPSLNPGSPWYRASALNAVHERARRYAAKGLPADQALMLGVADVEAADPDIDQKIRSKPAPRKGEIK